MNEILEGLMNKNTRTRSVMKTRTGVSWEKNKIRKREIVNYAYEAKRKSFARPEEKGNRKPCIVVRQFFKAGTS